LLQDKSNKQTAGINNSGFKIEFMETLLSLYFSAKIIFLSK